jgi:DNA-binding transcriptional regulator YhcF (GntR family)
MEDRASAPYQRIADDIERRIKARELLPGDRVPSTRQITRDWGVAIATATRALRELAARGAVRAVPGTGTVVAARSERPPGREPPTRVASERSRVSLARIVEVAIALADAEGVGAVSMRRVATSLGVATMSLYRWVPNKETLLVGMLDELLGAGDWPAVPPQGWRAQLEYVARRQWHTYQEHPWLAHIVSLTRPQLAPNAMVHTEWALRAVDGFGLDSTTRLYLVLTLFGHVKAAATGLDVEQQAERDTGLDIEAWVRDHDARFKPVIQSGRFPHLAQLDDNADVELDLTALFEFGLASLLDGFANVLGSTRRRSRGAGAQVASTTVRDRARASGPRPVEPVRR